MIYEYAVEPALVARWAREGDVGLAGQFGLDQRRLVSDFPLDWVGEVSAELLKEFEYDAGDPDYIQANQFLSALLDFMSTNMISRGWRRNEDVTWLVQAEEVHQAEPFHAILVSANPAGVPAFITEDILQSPKDQRWYLPTVSSTAKTADDLAEHLEPLLRGASRLVIVDPYFDPRNESYRGVLATLIDRAIGLRGPGRTLPDVTLITGVAEDRPDGGTVDLESQMRNEAHNRCEWAQQYLPACLPKGLSLTFLCVANFPDGDKLHNRFVLTDFAGASLPYGTQALGAQVFDDISPLFKGQYQKRWRQYTRPEQLRIVGTPRVIAGSR